MKRIVVTDTHLGLKKANMHYLEVVFFLFEAIGEYAQAHGIKELIHLGDFFDNRKNMSLLTLFYANRIGLNLQRFDKSYLIIGNHDLFYKDKIYPNSHQVFNQMSHIQVISEPTVVGNIALVPWVLEGESLVLPDADFCMGHFEIAGAKMNVSGREAEGAVNFGDFSKYEMTLSGHFHTPGNYPNNVKYIGASHHMDFNDAGARGWYVFDDEDGSLEFIEWHGYPKFVQWVAKPDNIFGSEFKGNVVRIIFNEDFGTTINNQIIEDVRRTEPYQLFTEYRFTENMTADTIADEVSLMGPMEIHQDFIEKSEVPEHLNKKALVKMVEQLYGEVVQ